MVQRSKQRKRQLEIESCENRLLLAGDTVWFEQASATVNEAGEYLDQVLTVRRSNADEAQQVSIDFGDGTAVADVDFVGPNGSFPYIWFPPGETSLPVELDSVLPNFASNPSVIYPNVSIVDDLLHEPDKSIQLNLVVSGAGPTPEGQTSATILIRDDDPIGMQLNETDGLTVVTHEGGTDDLLVSLNASPDESVVVAVDFGDGLLPTSNELRFESDNWNQPQVINLVGTTPGPTTLQLSIVDEFSDSTFRSAPDIEFGLDVRAPISYEPSTAPGFDVANVNSTQTTGIRPYYFLPTDDGLYFTADDGIHGRELWKTDGTPSGTAQVHDIAPGSKSSAIEAGASYSFATVLGDSIISFADDGIHGTSVYRTDIESGEVVFLKAIDTFAGPQFIQYPPNSFATVGDEVFFIGGRSVWKTDVTVEGTMVVAQSNNGFPRALVSFKGRLFLVSDYVLSTLHESGRGTEPVPGAQIDNIVPLQVGGEHLYAVNNEGIWASADGEDFTKVASGRLAEYSDAMGTGDIQYFILNWKLVRSDGTESGTSRVPSGSSQLSYLFGVWDGKAIYKSGYDLWVADGSDAEVVASDIGIVSFQTSQPSAQLNDKIIFFADDGTHGTEPWISDGTAAGTHILRDVYPGAASSVEPRGAQLVEWQGKVFFRASNGSGGAELWSTDGTESGTRMVMDYQRSEGSTPQYHAVTDEGMAIFAADDGTNERAQLWRTKDGLTSLVHNLPVPQPRTTQADGSPAVASNAQLQEFVSRGELVYFLQRYNYSWGSGNYQHAFDLWVTDGTTSGTQLLERQGISHNYEDGLFHEPRIGFDETGRPTLSINPILFDPDFNLDPADILEPNQRLDATVGELTFSIRPGTPLTAQVEGQDPVVLAEFHPSQTAGHLSKLGGKLVFVVQRESRSELWVSDGTAKGTKQFHDFQYPIGIESKSDGELLYFTVEDTKSGPQLWRSNGTSDGTLRLSDHLRAPNSFVEFQGETYFSAVDDVVGRELWKTDGTVDGTQLVADLLPGIASSSPSDLAANEDELFFSANHLEYGREHWRFQPDSVELQADIDNNGVVDFRDFLVLSANFGQESTNGKSDGDIALDGVVGFDDFLLLAAEFGKS